MKFTKKEKKVIYTNLLAIITGNHSFGLCFNLTILSHCKEYGEWALSEMFPEIFKQKPLGIPLGAYWFPLSPEGDRERVNIIKKAIKEVT